MTFYHPWFLLLITILPVIAWRWWRHAKLDSIMMSSLSSDWTPTKTWRQHLVWMPSILTLLALVLMIVSLARPRFGRQQTIVNSEGIAIEMVIEIETFE